MTLCLHSDKKICKIFYFLRESCYNFFVFALTFNIAVIKRSVDLMPSLVAACSSVRSNERICALMRQQMEHGIVCGAHRTAKASPTWPAAPVVN